MFAVYLSYPPKTATFLNNPDNSSQNIIALLKLKEVEQNYPELGNIGYTHYLKKRRENWFSPLPPVL